MGSRAHHSLLAASAGGQGLTLSLGLNKSPSDGYKLAADYCQHYDSSHGTCLVGPSRTKIMEIVRFMFSIEAGEELKDE